MSRMGLGPVFLWEWRRVSRQWWFYAARSVLAGGLLVGLMVAWWVETSQPDLSTPRTMAKVGVWFFGAIVLAQLSMVLLAAPAATAGAFGAEKSRGQILLMLLTEVTSLDIVLGTLAGRLLPVLAGVVCVVPVLTLAAHLGGIPPQALVDLFVVTTGSAVLGCSMALLLSIGARRVHEALVATYVLMVGWVLGYPIVFTIRMTAVGRLIPGWWMPWLLDINPFWLALAPVLGAGAWRPGESWAFLSGSLALSAILLGLAVWRLRPAVVADRCLAPRWSLGWLLTSSGLASTLDFHPVFWRECRLQRPLSWIRVLWGLYIAGAVIFSVLAASECAVKGVRRTFWAGPFNGFQATVGLLLLSLITPASLAEERAQGSLEVLLSTPLSTRSLVLGKWLAHYRVVVWLALLPGIVAVAHAATAGRWLGVPLVIGAVLARGAAVTSLGIALATWVPRLDRALTLSAAVSVFVSVAWIPLVALLFQSDKMLGLGMAEASPLFGVGMFTAEMASASIMDWRLLARWSLFWIFVFSVAALILVWATLATFDSCLGRITQRTAAMRRSALRSRFETGRALA
jgi:ABC-type transport system involved in multi-copper enzyme maturation permease subunit